LYSEKSLNITKPAKMFALNLSSASSKAKGYVLSGRIEGDSSAANVRNMRNMRRRVPVCASLG
jgi:hypothetical protein